MDNALNKKFFQVLEGIPCILSVDELRAAYPEAKVILTNRDVDSWLASMEKAFYTVLNWKTAHPRIL